MLALASLFTVAFLAATILPLQSEAVLAGLYLSGNYNAALLLFTATAGNVLGACVNWWLGRHLQRFKDKRWFPVSKKLLARARIIYRRYGVWTLLLAWVPFIGDPLTIIAGILRTPFWLFAVLVTFGKAGRYYAILAALQ